MWSSGYLNRVQATFQRDTHRVFDTMRRDSHSNRKCTPGLPSAFFTFQTGQNVTPDVLLVVLLSLQIDINGRALMRLNDEKLERLGVDHPNHRYEILNEILKQVKFPYFFKISKFFIISIFFQNFHLFFKISKFFKNFQHKIKHPF